MNAWIWKRVTFDAAHHLPDYEGPCKRVHGHTYFVELGIFGTIGKKTGMAIDLSFLHDFLRSNVVALMDHADLNERLPLQPPTAENIGLYILKVAVKYFDRDSSIRRPIKVRVYETPDSWVELKREDLDNG